MIRSSSEGLEESLRHRTKSVLIDYVGYFMGMPKYGPQKE
jgi:hypothetical protein